MSTHLADKLMPYMTNLLLVQVILLCATALVGCIALLRRRLKKQQPFEGSATVDHERIAGEITQEILRLRELRNRIYPTLDDSSEPTPTLATTRGPSESSASVDVAALEIDIRKGYEGKIRALEARIQELEKELSESAVQSAANEAPPQPANAGQLEMLKKEFEQDRETLKDQVSHLEKVLAEYKIFEEDFALARRFKTENEQLRKQLSETHNITEDDIASLFKSADTPGTEGSELFGASDLADLTSASESVETATEAPEPLASQPADAQTIESASQEEPAPQEAEASSGDDLMAALEAELAQAGTGPTNEPTPLEGGTSESTVEPSVTAEPSVAAEPSEAAPASDANASKGFEVEQTQEPEITRAMTEETMEDLAESAVNDDELIAEFQKILGDQQT